jgi:hypothetical protein
MKDGKRFNTFWVGLIFGAVGLVIGFFAIGALWAVLNDSTLRFWVDVVFIEVPIYRTQVFTGSALLDAAAFFVLYQKGYHDVCKGILGILILLVLYMIYSF